MSNINKVIIDTTNIWCSIASIVGHINNSIKHWTKIKGNIVEEILQYIQYSVNIDIINPVAL